MCKTFRDFHISVPMGRRPPSLAMTPSISRSVCDRETKTAMRGSVLMRGRPRPSSLSTQPEGAVVRDRKTFVCGGVATLRTWVVIKSQSMDANYYWEPYSGEAQWHLDSEAEARAAATTQMSSGVRFNLRPRTPTGFPSKSWCSSPSSEDESRPRRGSESSEDQNATRIALISENLVALLCGKIELATRGFDVTTFRSVVELRDAVEEKGSTDYCLALLALGFDNTYNAASLAALRKIVDPRTMPIVAVAESTAPWAPPDEGLELTKATVPSVAAFDGVVCGPFGSDEALKLARACFECRARTSPGE